MNEQVAVVAGIGQYPFGLLENAVSDAEGVHQVLCVDYGFSPGPPGGLLLDDKADLAALEEAVTASLDRAGADSRWLFYFAGHGHLERDEVYLIPFRGRAEDLETCLPLEWLVARALGSRAGEALIVVDACYAAQVLASDLKDCIERDAAETRSTVQILASGLQDVLDGGGGRHSVFTASLLEALGGWPAIHDDDDGAVRFSKLKDHLDREVELKFDELELDHRQQLVGATLSSGPGGDFRLEPSRTLIPPDVVRAIRQDASPSRRRALAKLERFVRDQPAPSAANVSLARRLVLEGRPRTAEVELWPSPLDDLDPRVRWRAARLLGRLEGGAARSRKSVKRLLSVALDDPRPAVRHEARKSLARVWGSVDPPVATEADETPAPRRLRAAWASRWRRWSLRVTVPSCRRRLGLLARALAYATRGLLGMGHAARLYLESRWRRGLTFGAAAGLVLVYLYLGAHYFVSAEGSQVVLRIGLSGFEALPGMGEIAVATGYNLGDLENPRDATEERLDGWWLSTRHGVRAWGPRLASRLDPAHAALAHWRLGDLETALAWLARDLGAGRKESVKPAAYVAFHSDDAFPSVVELLVEALADHKLRDDVIEALEVLRTARPEAAAAAADRLRGAPEGSPEREAAAILEGEDEEDGGDETADPRTLPSLLAAVADADPEVRGPALRSLVRRALDGDVDLATVESVLATALDERSPWIRKEAIHGVLLLADSSDSLFEAAFRLAVQGLGSEWGWQYRDEYEELFRSSSPVAAARFGRRLLLYLLEEEPPVERDLLFVLVRGLVESHPRILQKWLPELTDDDRRAAALMLGPLLAESPEPAARALDELEKALEERDAELRSRTAESLKWIAKRQGDLAPRAVGLLLGGLADSEPAVRASFAEALASAARADTARLPVSQLVALRRAMADEDPAVRRDAARALALFGKRQRRELAETVDWVRERLAREAESRVRLELAAALGTLAGEDPEVVDEVAGIVRSELRSGEAYSGFRALEEVADAHPGRSRQAVRLLLDLEDLVEPTQRVELVRAIGRIGFHHESGARAALAGLGSYLEEDDADLRFEAIHNGIEPIARFHPSLRSEVLRVLEWAELLAEAAAEDLDVLWRRLGSRGSGDRDAGLEILGHLCRKRPDLIPEIRAGLEKRRLDVRPYVRDGAARALELILILERTADFRGAEASRERWEVVLRWINDRRFTDSAWELLHESQG